MTVDDYEFSWQGPFDDFNEFAIAVTTTDGPLPGPWAIGSFLDDEDLRTSVASQHGGSGDDGELLPGSSV